METTEQLKKQRVKIKEEIHAKQQILRKLSAKIAVRDFYARKNNSGVQ